jgi:hypothetical protein
MGNAMMPEDDETAEEFWDARCRHGGEPGDRFKR